MNTNNLQIKRSISKYIGLGIVAILLLLPMILIQIPSIQQRVLQAATNYIEEKTETKIHIQSVGFHLFNKLSLKGVVWNDSAGDTLLSAKRLSIGFEFWPLFKKQYRIRSAQFNTFTVYLNKENENAPLNIQSILQAFQNTTDTPIDLCIKNISLYHGNIIYLIKNQTITDNTFNFGDLCFSNINSKININKLTTDSLNIFVKQLNFKEKSGFQLRNLQFDLSANKDSVNVQKLKLQLPESQLNIINISSDYSVLQTNKNDWKNRLFNLQIQDSYLCSNDLKAFIPTLNNYPETIHLQGSVSGKLNEICFSQIHLFSVTGLDLIADVNLHNMTSKNPSEIYLHTCLSDSYVSEKFIRDLMIVFNTKPVQWPSMIEQIAYMNLNGEISGFLNHLNADLKCITNIGDLQVQLDFSRTKELELRGDISSNEMNINKLLENNDFGNARFQLHFSSRFQTSAEWQGNVEASIEEFTYKSYPYSHIRLTGDYAHNQLQCYLNTQDPNGNIEADASIRFEGDKSEYTISADVSKLQLDRLNLTRKNNNPQLSFHLESLHCKGNTLNNLTGRLQINKIQFETDDKKMNINKLAANILETDSIKKLYVKSDILSGEISGIFDFSTLPMALKQSIAEYMPSLINDKPAVWPESNQYFTWNFTINNTETLSSILDLPATLYDKSQIEGKFDNRNRQFRLTASVPKFSAGGSMFENGTLNLNNGNGYLELNVNSTNLLKKNGKLAMEATCKAVNDSLFTALHWDDKGKYNGRLFFTSQITMPSADKPVEAFLRFQSSEMMFNDSIWTITPMSVHYYNKVLNISQFEAKHNQQDIKINGNISNNENDEIFISLNKVDLDYIFKSINIQMHVGPLIFGGIATGDIRAKDLYHTRQLSTRLDIRDFSFNNQIFGDLDLLGLWNDEKQNVEMIGEVVKNDSSYVNINGYIDPMNEKLSILFNTHKSEVRFLHPFLDKIIKNLSGEATGPIRLFGSLNDPTVEGEIWLQDGSFGIEFLNTRYSFSDWITFKPDEILMHNVTMYDKDGHPALFTGSVKHDLLSNFRFSAHISCENFLIFNATYHSSPNFYGTVYGTGQVDIAGNEQLVNINMEVINDENTELVIDLMKQADVADFNFIRFTSKEKEIENPMVTQISDSRDRKDKKKNRNSDTSTEIHLNMIVNANNKATVNFIMDPVMEDKISATGTGSLQVQYGTDMPPKVFGNYRIEQGKYNFSFQQAIFRKFDIANGSSIAFKGDPLIAEMDVKATCEVSANLGDLNQQLISASDRRSARTSVPVNCVLLLSGPLEQPNIKFDLEMPKATSELERQVKSYIRTEDMMNRQIIYLLIMNRFYTPPEYAATNSGFNNDFSLLSSTLSSSISSLLGNLSDKIQVGTNFHQFYENDVSKTEIELLLSSTLLNNRLIINGNIGYIDSPYVRTPNNDIPLIGDFDFEYKLTSNGNVRLKGFNRYNYRNYYSLMPEMTQGFGILFRKDFNNLREFFLRKKELMQIPTENTSKE